MLPHFRVFLQCWPVLVPQITGLPPLPPVIEKVSVVQSPWLFEAKAASEAVDGPAITNVYNFEKIIKIMLYLLNYYSETLNH